MLKKSANNFLNLIRQQVKNQTTKIQDDKEISGISLENVAVDITSA